MLRSNLMFPYALAFANPPAAGKRETACQKYRFSRRCGLMTVAVFFVP